MNALQIAGMLLERKEIIPNRNICINLIFDDFTHFNKDFLGDSTQSDVNSDEVAYDLNNSNTCESNIFI